MERLGDVVFDDASYTGESGDSAFSIQYYRDRIGEFQQKLESLDQTARAVRAVWESYSPWDETGNLAPLGEWLADFDATKDRLRVTAQAVNVAAEGANAVGLRMPVLSIPQGLSAFPPVVIGAVAAAVAGTAWAISYMVAKIAQAQADMARVRGNAEIIQSLPEAERARFAEQTAEAERSIEQARAAAPGALGDVADIFRWGAIAVLAYIGLKLFMETR